MKVLIVDDNRELADLMQDALEGEGMEVMSAGYGIEGYAVYLLFRPDLVITDIQMPGGTGFQMMRHIRAHDPTIRTVYMSGNIDSYLLSLEREKKSYPVTILSKPFSLQSLMKLVSEPPTSVPMEEPAILYHESRQQPPRMAPHRRHRRQEAEDWRRGLQD